MLRVVALKAQPPDFVRSLDWCRMKGFRVDSSAASSGLSMKKESNQNLSGNEVDYKISFILPVNNTLCRKLHFQKDFESTPFSAKIGWTLSETTRRCTPPPLQGYLAHVKTPPQHLGIGLSSEPYGGSREWAFLMSEAGTPVGLP